MQGTYFQQGRPSAKSQFACTSMLVVYVATFSMCFFTELVHDLKELK